LKDKNRIRSQSTPKKISHPPILLPASVLLGKNAAHGIAGQSNISTGIININDRELCE
jgi:hypothetical protein